jgi:hypothetical protein
LKLEIIKELPSGIGSLSFVDAKPAQDQNQPVIENSGSCMPKTSDHVLKNLPSDFFSCGQKNLDACFGEAMQVIQDDRIIEPIPEGIEELDCVEQLSKVIMRWASGWGGITYWSILLDDSFI